MEKRLELTERQEQILQMTFRPGEHKAYTATEIAEEMGVHRNTIVNEKRRAMDAIKAHIMAGGITDWDFLYWESSDGRLVFRGKA